MANFRTCTAGVRNTFGWVFSECSFSVWGELTPLSLSVCFCPADFPPPSALPQKVPPSGLKQHKKDIHFHSFWHWMAGKVYAAPSGFSVIPHWALNLWWGLEVGWGVCVAKWWSSSNTNRPELSLQTSVVRDSTSIVGDGPNRGDFLSNNIKQLICPCHGNYPLYLFPFCLPRESPPLALQSVSTQSLLKKIKYLQCIIPPVSAHPSQLSSRSQSFRRWLHCQI